MIKCCKGCVPPKRHTACHDTCPEYQAEGSEDFRKKQIEKQKRALERALDGDRIRAIKKIKEEGRRHV
jgi:hypothetical protein